MGAWRCANLAAIQPVTSLSEPPITVLWRDQDRLAGWELVGVVESAELLVEPSDRRGAFITGSDFLMDGGVTASYFYGELAPQ